MKKSLIILAIIAMAGLSQAAAVKWNATGTAATEGLTAYFVMNSALPASITDISQITGNASGSASIVKDGRTYWTKDQTISLNPSENAPGSTVPYTIFVVSGDQYYTVGGGNATVYDDLATPPAAANTDGSIKNTNIPAVGGTGWTVVPEPTTVALLALGLAALGLKRKVA